VSVNTDNWWNETRQGEPK